MAKPTGPTRAWTWGRRQWFHLLACVVGFAMVVACVVMVMGPQLRLSDKESYLPLISRHGFGGWVAEGVNPLPTMFTHGQLPPWRSHEPEKRAVVLLAPTSAVAMDMTEVPAARWMARRVGFGALRVFEVGASGGATPGGSWATTSHEWNAQTYANWMPAFEPGVHGIITDEERVAIRRAYWEETKRRDPLEYASMVPGLIANKNHAGSIVQMSGYAINAATILGLGMWVLFTPLTIRDLRRLRRKRRGACAMCGYDLKGLPKDAPVCPECAAPFQLREVHS